MKLTLVSILASLALSSIASAATLNCHIDINNDPLLQTSVETKTKQKVKIGDVDTVTAYITEKVDGIYTLEAFIANAEMRIYSEGMLKSSNDRLSTSVWSRDILLDIECSPAQK